VLQRNDFLGRPGQSLAAAQRGEDILRSSSIEVRWTTSADAGILKEVADKEPSMTVGAHFDGRVIVPDEPLDLPANQALIVQIERVGGEAVPSDESALTWLAAHAVDSEALPTNLAHGHDHYLYGRTCTDERQ
jgi:hypothetical protein